MKIIKSIATETLNLKSNPYLSLFFGSLRDRGVSVFHLSDIPDGMSVDLVHLHWPEKFLRKLYRHRNRKALLKFLFTLAGYKRRKVPIIWTVHNALPHEKHAPRMITAAFYRILTYFVDGCLYMSEAGRRQCEVIHPTLAGKPSAVVPHGHYRDVITCSQPAALTREQLCVEAGRYLIGHFGLIRGYKNTLQLVKAFKELSPDDAVLLIAGKSWSKTLEREIESAVQGNDNIRYINRALDEAEMSDYVSAADLVALPYKRVSNSGAALYALSLNTPVLGPAQGAFLDLADSHSDWVFTYPGEFTAEVLRDGLEWVRTGARQAELDLSEYDWKVLADQTIDFYLNVQAHR